MLETFRALDVPSSIENVLNLTNVASTIPALVRADFMGEPCWKLAGDTLMPDGTSTMAFLPTVLLLEEYGDDKGALKARVPLLWILADCGDEPRLGASFALMAAEPKPLEAPLLETLSVPIAGVNKQAVGDSFELSVARVVAVRWEVVMKGSEEPGADEAPTLSLELKRELG